MIPALPKKFLSIFLFVAIAITIQAQQWTLGKKLDVNNGGLPQNTCKDMYFDKTSGFLWISTESGLVRYDGKNQKVFDMRNTKGLSTSRLGPFSNTSDGQVFVFPRPGDPLLIHDNLPIAIDLPRDYPVYTAYFMYHEGVVCQVQNPLGYHANNNISLLDFRSLWMKSADWVSTYYDTLLYTSNKRILKKWTFGPGHLSHLIDVPNGVYLTKSNGQWYFLNTITDSIYSVRPSGILLQPNVQIFYNIHQTDPLAILGNDVYKIKFIHEIPTPIFFAHLPEIPDHIRTLIINPDNQHLYCGTNLSGLYIYQASNFDCYRVQESDNQKKTGEQKEINNIYPAVFTDSTHILTNTGVLFSLANNTYRFIKSMTTNFASHRMTLMYLGNGWASIPYNPLFNVEKDTKREAKELRNISAYYQSANGTRWFAQMQIFIYKNDSLVKVFPFEKFPEQVQKNLLARNGFRETAFAGETADHQLLMTDGVYFILVDTAKMIATIKFKMDNITRKSVMDDDGKYCWIPTYGEGFYLYDIKENRLYKAPLDSKQYLLYSHSLAPDGHGNLLIPTNNGVFRINRELLINACKGNNKNLVYEYYGSENGLADLEFNGGCAPAYNKMQNGDVIFPSQNGLVRVLTSTLSESIQYPLFVENVKTPDTTYAFYNRMHFNSNERVLSWNVNFAQWSALYATGLAYKLDDAEQWTYLPPGERNFQLVDLSGGSHQIQIRNQNDLSGKHSYQISLQFDIEKKYYELFFFWLIIFFAILLITAFTTTLVTGRIKRQNVLLEKKVTEKTLELSNKNNELEETLGELEQLMVVLNNNSSFQKKLLSLMGHDFMVPLQYISKVSGQLRTYKSKLSTTTKDESVEEINSTASALIYMGQNIIQWIKLQEGNFTPQAEYLNLPEVTNELLSLHRRLVIHKQNTITVDIQDGLLVFFDPVIIRIIVHNLLANANKFTGGGHIFLNCFEKDQGLVIEVRDTGTGMDDVTLHALNNAKQVSPLAGTGKEKGWGFGYRLITDLLASCNGKLSITSAKGSGTAVNIFIPDIV